LQRAVLDPAMQGRDLIARAKTGTGKTLAFGIPIINNILLENEGNRTARVVSFSLLLFSTDYLVLKFKESKMFSLFYF